MKHLSDLDFRGKKVLVRVDFNVPMDKAGNITDDTRMRESLPTFKTILDQGGTLILMGHLGRPEGKSTPSLSLAPCAQRLSELLQQPVTFIDDCIGEKVEKKVASLTPGSILLLENLRFYAAEEKPTLDPTFAKKLASLGELYVDDAFGSSHRAHSSIFEVPKFFPNKRVPGLLMEKEYTYLNSLFSHPTHPFFALIGGSKISSKFGVLQSLLAKVDALFIGGGMVFTLLKAQGIPIGDSICEDSLLSQAQAFLKAAGSKLLLPEDIVIADQFSSTAKTRIVSSHQGIPPGWRGMDIGPATLSSWGERLSAAATLFWNGPLGVYEIPPFEKGTHGIAKKIASLTQMGTATVVGGGDSLAAIHQLNLNNQFSHLSTGGGACLEFLEFGHLPGIEILLIDQ